MRMRKRLLFCASMYQHVPYGTQQDFNKWVFLQKRARNC